MQYDYSRIEKKWQGIWDEKHPFEAKQDFSLPKYYALVEFPYPSGSGMHVGHIKAYSGLEVVSRKRRLEGYNVLFPIGFDAYGLPTENTAIKTGVGDGVDVITEGIVNGGTVTLVPEYEITMIFDNEMDNPYWLSGDYYIRNIFNKSA